MTTAPRDTAHGGRVQEILLLHPDSLDAHRCRVAVTRRGLVLRRMPDRPSRTGRAGRAVRVPWWTVRGFSADDTETAPDGTRRQVVEVVTDAGSLFLLAPAFDVAVLLREVSRRSGRWNRSRRPLVAAAARASAMAGAVLRPIGAPLRSAAAAVGEAAIGVAGLLFVVLVALARPVGHRLVRTATPIGRRLASTVVGLAVGAAWRWTRPLLVRGLGGRRLPARLLRPALIGSVSLVLAGGVVFSVTGDGTLASGVASTGARLALATGAEANVDSSGLARMLQVSGWGKDAKPIDLPKASAPPAPAPPSLAAEPPLSSHEVFGFAPYWTLTQSTAFDVGGMTTLAYFSIGVNPDGSLDESGTGWDGYQSQDLANLVTRAHAAGVRVVLTVNCFDQTSLNQLTSSSTAPATLSAALLQAIEAKNLDGVNLDFEGEGSADQVGLTNLVTQVSAAIHAANPHYQVTMDTYASSAGDPNGFYDIPALAPAVDAFFVMAYQLNLQASPTPASPLTSAMFSDLTTAEQYSAAVPADKVIMGVPYYGYSWPTSNGTMAAQATGPATPIGDGQIMASGNPVYWDSVTDTAWTSYQVGSQWYEDYFEDPSSLYLVAQMSQFFDLGGLGIWALGMDGNNAQMLAALDGFAPAAKDGLAGPTATVPTTSVPTSTTSTTAAADAGSTTTSTTAATGAGSTTTSTTGAASTSGNGSTPALRYSGVWKGQQVSLTLQKSFQIPTSGVPSYLGQLTGFQTDDPTLACLESSTGLDVWAFATAPTQYVVVAEQPTDCATADLTFTDPSTPSSASSVGTSATSVAPPTTTATPSVATPSTAATTPPATTTTP